MAFDLDEFLTKSHQANASDIHINCNKPPMLRIHGEIYKIAGSIITAEDIKAITEKTIPKFYLEQNNISIIQDLDYIYEIKGVSRYRVNYCRDIHGGKLTFRIIPYSIKTLKELCLPECLKECTKYNNGIIIMTGATGSGKSTTLASLIEIINQEKKKHIITIEDPVEFVYEDKKALITQRNVGVNVKDFKAGIKYALRQNPDIILVGEIRDKDTLLSAVEAAETGHLVFSTLHTNGTVASIDRLKGFIEEEGGQYAFQKRLSNCIRAVIHQQLVPKANEKGLVPAIEFLSFTPTVIDYINQNKLHEIELLMQRSTQDDLFTMNSFLYKLFQDGTISQATALEHSFNKVEMNQMIKGMNKKTMIEDSIL